MLWAVRMIPSSLSWAIQSTMWIHWRKNISGMGMNPEVPKHYFPDDDPTKQPEMKWSAHGQWIYSNWMNYFVYQTTPYELKNGVFVPVE